MSIETWAGRSHFEYTGCVTVGTDISFGEANKRAKCAEPKQRQIIDLARL